MLLQGDRGHCRHSDRHGNVAARARPRDAPSNLVGGAEGREMNCEETRDYLAAYLDGELDVASTISIERHLRACPDCRRARDGARSLRTAIKGADLYEVPSP